MAGDSVKKWCEDYFAGAACTGSEVQSDRPLNSGTATASAACLPRLPSHVGSALRASRSPRRSGARVKSARAYQSKVSHCTEAAGECKGDASSTDFKDVIVGAVRG